MHRGVATFTLDTGKCPKWLFKRMVALGQQMVQLLVAEFGPDEFIRRIGEPVWFQTLGTVLAFDWNASGLTTTLTGALKEAIRGQERDLGIFICGGKGKTSRKTPDQITQWGERLSLPYSRVKKYTYLSRMSAKVDSALVQDDYQIYHHCFFFSKNGPWAVVQQGMNTAKKSARRYHWSSDKASDLINEPHSGIASTKFLNGPVLNLTSSKSIENRKTSLGLVNTSFHNVLKDLQILRKHSSDLSRMISLKQGNNQLTFLELSNTEFHHHSVELESFANSKYLQKIIWKLCDHQPTSYESLLSTEGVGPKTIRALSLVSEVIYGAPASYQDPARYSFAHGGKDGTPYFVDRKTYDLNIQLMQKLVRKLKIPPQEKDKTLRRLQN